MITKNNALRINCSTIKEFKEKYKNVDFIFSFLDVKEYYDWDYSCYFEFKYPVLENLNPSIIVNDNLCNQNYKPTTLYWDWGFTEKNIFKERQEILAFLDYNSKWKTFIVIFTFKPN